MDRRQAQGYWYWLGWSLVLALTLGGLYYPGEGQRGGNPEPVSSTKPQKSLQLESWLWRLPGEERDQAPLDPNQATVTVNERQQLVVAAAPAGGETGVAGAPVEEAPSPRQEEAAAGARPRETLSEEEFYRLLQRYEGELRSRDFAKRAQNLPRHWLTDIVKKYAKIYALDPRLVWTVIRHESGFNPRAVSPKGAMGLMQLIPSTASLMGVSDPFDIEQNIHGGVKYLKYCLTRFGNNLIWALAAYNAGPDNVAKYQGCPPFAETRAYVLRIMRDYTGQEVYLPPVLLASASTKATLAAAEKKPVEEKPGGLDWKIPAPQVKVGPPTWKIPLRPTIVLAKIPTPLRQNPEVARLLAKHGAGTKPAGPASP